MEPEGEDGLISYLSGCLKGVGPKTAQLLVDALGEGVLAVLDAQDAVKQLRQVGAGAGGCLGGSPTGGESGGPRPLGAIVSILWCSFYPILS